MKEIEEIFYINGEWIHKNLVYDLRKISKEVRRGECDLGDIFHIFHYGSCTVDITYNLYAKTLNLKIVSETENNTKKTYETLDKKIEEYSKEYCDPTGLQI
ncbi:MAG: hypothetical protein PHV16_02945 [Candidatus Nanoarchaeia archaeon]|nr:hypothetical protein [Candidatus Nanoarchaeia archaeon]